MPTLKQNNLITYWLRNGLHEYTIWSYIVQLVSQCITLYANEFNH